MSVDASPITPARFAEALKDLPIGSLHEKGAELRNSIGHLKSSNEQIRDYLLAQPANAPADADCVEAIQENVQVIKRIEERISLVKAEVEERGLPWPTEEEVQNMDLDPQEPGEVRVNGQVNGLNGTQPVSGQPRQQSGRLTDEELHRRLQERLGEQEGPEDEDEGGLHL